MSDRYSVGFVHAEITRHGLTHRPSELDKSQLYLNALPAFGSSKVRMVDNKTAVEQFCSLQQKAGSFGGRDRVDARGGKSEDSANVIAGVISLLAKPMTGALAWNEYMRRQCVEAGVSFNRAGVDMDSVRTPGPDFGFNLHTAPLVRVFLPPIVAAEGRLGNASVRFIEGKGFVELTRAEACDVLRHQSYRCLNERLAQQLLEGA